jgi:hypothetical protein
VASHLADELHLDFLEVYQSFPLVRYEGVYGSSGGYIRRSWGNTVRQPHDAEDVPLTIGRGP